MKRTMLIKQFCSRLFTYSILDLFNTSATFSSVLLSVRNESMRAWSLVRFSAISPSISFTFVSKRSDHCSSVSLSVILGAVSMANVMEGMKSKIIMPIMFFIMLLYHQWLRSVNTKRSQSFELMPRNLKP